MTMDAARNVADAFLFAQAEQSSVHVNALGEMARKCAEQLYAKEVLIAELAATLKEFCDTWNEYGDPDNKAVNDAWLKASATLNRTSIAEALALIGIKDVPMGVKP